VSFLKDVSIEEYDEAVLVCVVDGSIPVAVTWYKDEQKLDASQKFQLSIHESVYSLYIQQFTRDDNGVYKVVVKDDFGSDEALAELFVKCKSYIVVKRFK